MSKQAERIVRALEIPGFGQDEISFMEDTVLQVEPHFIGEWGTNRGSSARIFWELSKFHSLHPAIVTVELPVELAPLSPEHPGDAVGQFIKGLPVTQVYGDGVTEALTHYARFGKPLRSLFFIDGDHSGSNVYRELMAISSFAFSATILLHDTFGQQGKTGPGPGEAVEWFINRMSPGVYRKDVLRSQAGMTRLTPCHGSH